MLCSFQKLHLSLPPSGSTAHNYCGVWPAVHSVQVWVHVWCERVPHHVPLHSAIDVLSCVQFQTLKEGQYHQTQLYWTCSICSAEQGLLQVPFARTSIRQNRSFSVLGSSFWNNLQLALRSLPRTYSQPLLPQLQSVFFTGSTSEQSPLKMR